MTTLYLPLKREYFEAIRDGRKPEEYRLCTPHWRKRLEGREFDQVVLTLGYPARDDQARRLVRAWRGFTIKTITHPHFGTDPVEVFAIDVSEPATQEVDQP
ncbi:ASCH domain-containing protein [Comamonas sp. UBA7528]|uniref:ASCH domain-containing protein n=1 Tax=Comamonas sp. UBA7528 TaxID=1946391 RepID=UPI0025C25958|nr:ASCH domain-containing protein [Comamonas sp. UBA7528]